MKLMMFTKHLRELPLDEAGRVMKQLGFAGADLTVRPGGFVLPEQVREKLPEAVRVLHNCGLEVPLVTTGITSADDPAAEPTFAAAAECGVPELKLGYVQYGGFGTLRSELDLMRRQLDGLERLAQSYRVRTNLHIHSGDYLTALAPIVWWLIKDRDPAAIGAYIDPGHMVLEGGRGGWRMGIDLLADRISLVAIKDVAWHKLDRPRQPNGTAWEPIIVPLSQGLVPWRQVFDCLRQAGFTGWLSTHSEYQGRMSWKNLNLPDLITQAREDLNYLRQFIT